uniref:Sieve element occlusion N-terminal domain-containing protein n=1 Tax=Fagus sylvatica TaxID=28930 RepID=A0A2N9E6R4_FAGSY
MASKEAPGTAQQAIEYEIMSVPTGYKYNNDEILNQIDSIHVTGGGEFDTESLFILVENIFNHAAPIVGSYVPGAQLPLENMEDKDMALSVCFNSPFCTLKQISCKMASKAWGEVNAHETTLAILDMLSSYSWDARAVMTLAAFTLDYGKFWLLMQIHTSDQLAKSMAFLKGLPVLAEHSGLQKRQQALAELNHLIKVTLEVIKCIFELEKLPNYGRENVPALSKALVMLMLNFFPILSDVLEGIGPSGGSIQLGSQSLPHPQQSQDATEYMQTTNRRCVMAKCNVLQLIDGSNEVYFDILKHKYVLLLISGPDITDKDLSTLKQLRKEIGSRGKVVWVPIVVQSKTTINIERKFRSLGSEVPLYIVHQFLPIPGIKFIREEWLFTNKPIVGGDQPKSEGRTPYFGRAD